MLERFFTAAEALHRLRVGPGGPYLEGYAAALVAAQYRPRVIGQRVRDAAHLCEWAARRGLAIKDLDSGALARFVRHLATCRCRGNGPRGYYHWCWVRPFLQYLRRRGLVAPAPPTPVSALVGKYETWMRNQRGAAEATVVLHRRLAEAFVQAVGEDPSRYHARAIRTFVLSRVRDHERHAPESVTTVVRSFLRYLAAAGRCTADLAGAVPRVPTWRLAELPRYLAPEAIERIIGTSASKAPRDLRDRAILLLLARLGVRAGDIVNLLLDDVDWASGLVRVRGKGRRESWLPLPQEVGDALLEYLTHARPAGPDSHVFLTVRAPRTQLSATCVSTRVRVAIAAAGVRAPSRGAAHLLRHSLASRMLREGATLESIGTVLRHRHIETTALYAKVDVTLLQQIAQPWPAPEVSPC